MDPNQNNNPNPAPEPSAAPTPEASAQPQATPQPQSGAVAPATKPVANKKPISKKLIFIGVGALALILLVVLGIAFIPKLFKSDEAKLASKIFDEDILIAVEQDDKYGYINLKGKMVIQPQFEKASDFQGDKAIVGIKDGDDTNYAVIDRKGKIILKAENNDSISYDSENEIWRVGDQIFDKDLKKILPDGKEVYNEDEGYYLVANIDNPYAGEKTIYNKKGKAVYSYTANSTYWDISSGSDALEQAYAVLKIDEGKYRIVNPDSGKVIEENLEYNNVWADDYTSICLYDGKNCNNYLLIWNDKIIKKYDYRIEVYLYGTKKDGYYKIYDDTYSSSSKHDTEYLDFKSGQIVTETPKQEESDSDNLSEWEITTNSTIFSCSNGYGLMINKTQAIPCEYNHIRTPDAITYEYLKGKGKNYVIGNKDDKSYLLQAKNGKVVTEFDTSYLDFETLSSFIGEEEEDNQYHIYNLATGKSLKVEASDVYFEPMYIEVKKDDGKTEYYNKNLKLFYTAED